MWNQGETKDKYEQHNGPAPPGARGPGPERGGTSAEGEAGLAQKEGDCSEESVASLGVQLGFLIRPSTPGLFPIFVECIKRHRKHVNVTPTYHPAGMMCSWCVLM